MLQKMVSKASHDQESQKQPGSSAETNQSWLKWPIGLKLLKFKSMKTIVSQSFTLKGKVGDEPEVLEDGSTADTLTNLKNEHSSCCDCGESRVLNQVFQASLWQRKVNCYYQVLL